MKITALITGATSGIGLELARIHASKNGNLVLIARNKLKLSELKKELESRFKISVYIIEKDLSKNNSAKEIFEETQRRKLQIDYLINNAGFGLAGHFIHTNLDKETEMINLNITSLVQLTKLYIKEMVNRKNGKIMNVSSTAAFQPGPTFSVYSASKAFVLSFSEAINNEVKPFGVTCTSLCPGPSESNFHSIAGTNESRLVKGKKLPSAKVVAEYGYNSMLKGKPVAIYGLLNYMLSNLVRFAPREVIVNITRKLLDK